MSSADAIAEPLLLYAAFHAIRVTNYLIGKKNRSITVHTRGDSKRNMKQNQLSPETAEAVALRAVAFIASDDDRLTRFLDLSGMTPSDLKQNVTEPWVLAGALDFLLDDETLIFLFAEHCGLAPEAPRAARRALGGAGSGRVT